MPVTGLRSKLFEMEVPVQHHFKTLLKILLIPCLILSGACSEQKGKEEAGIDIQSLYPTGGGRIIDEETGLIVVEGYEVVKAQCGSCHSARLVAQNSFDREGWKDLIEWMQKEHNLWDLGEHETVILDYLEKNYAPTKKGRRAPLSEIDWYVLNE